VQRSTPIPPTPSGSWQAAAAAIAAAWLLSCGQGFEARRAEATRLQARGQPKEAAAILEEMAQKRPDDAALLLDLATALFDAGRLDQALGRAEKVLALDPTNGAARVLHARVLGALGREQEALFELRQVAAAEPRRIGVHRAMAGILARSGHNGAAVNQYEKELALSPDDAETLTDLGVFYLTTQQMEQAEDRLRRAAAAGDTARAHRYLAEVYFKQMRTEEGLKEQRRAIDLDPKDVDLLVNHARALAGYGHAAEARTVLQGAIDRGEKDARIYVELGRQSREALDYDGAEKLFREALAIDPGLSDAQMNLGKILLFQEKRDEARAAFEAARALAPSDPYVYFYLATFLADDKKYDEAIALFRRSLDLDPYNPKAHYSLARALQGAGRKDEALLEFARHSEILQRLRETRQSGAATAD
jgi:tetratricopeptide (TPR) repeat protein